MNRKKFIRQTGYLLVGIPLGINLLQSCESIYYAKSSQQGSKIIIPKTEFYKNPDDINTKRKYVLLTIENLKFPVCLYHLKKENYAAALLQCTHRGCELEVGGGIYSCPCHGSEFNTKGEILSGPATKQLKTYTLTTDEKNIYLQLS